MKTFLVTQKGKPVVVNGISYYYRNIISVDDTDVDALDVCKKLLHSGALSNFNTLTLDKKKVSKPKKNNNKSKDAKSKETKSKVDNNKNKKDKKEEK